MDLSHPRCPRQCLALQPCRIRRDDPLDTGYPVELAALHHDLRQRFRGINVLGGCCGTDLPHVTAIAEACFGH